MSGVVVSNLDNERAASKNGGHGFEVTICDLKDYFQPRAAANHEWRSINNRNRYRPLRGLWDLVGLTILGFRCASPHALRSAD
ncbi:MAG: hypothetical protein QOF62_2779 [Pyrinomonadaceae bacterium]|jgi:hypothetical protein|nr:hypothetical protein [Pyrinomonadaceae bacterium]